MIFLYQKWLWLNWNMAIDVVEDMKITNGWLTGFVLTVNTMREPQCWFTTMIWWKMVKYKRAWEINFCTVSRRFDWCSSVLENKQCLDVHAIAFALRVWNKEEKSRRLSFLIKGIIMDDRTIRKRIASMTTSRDLHYVLNVIKQNMAKIADKNDER